MSIIHDAWEKLFEKYPIRQTIEREGQFRITAEQIREFKEPRLMTKFDTRESLPKVFGGNIQILPVTRGSYVLGDFELYHNFPEEDGREPIRSMRVPEFYETIDTQDIRSEAKAIHVMDITAILDHFLEEEDLVQTVSGRMKSEEFSFFVRGHAHKQQMVSVKNSQLEIDAGFENANLFCLLEAKNVIHSNFLIRQLYYPYRLWKGKIQKNIHPVFLVYSNNVFRLFEYEFRDWMDYNSIHLIRKQYYSLEDVDITLRDLAEIWRQTEVKPEPPKVPFVQADSFDKVISLMEHLARKPLTGTEIAELFGFQERQSDYYFNACRYLGLAEKKAGEDGVSRAHSTALGKRLPALPYKQRQLEYVRLILQHPLFHALFSDILQGGEIPDKGFIMARMREWNLCGESLLSRRASSVRGWLKWIRSRATIVE